MDYAQVRRMIDCVLDTKERECLNVYTQIAFGMDVSNDAIDQALSYFTEARGDKIILLDNLVSLAHKRSVDFSPAGQDVLNNLSSSERARSLCFIT